MKKLPENINQLIVAIDYLLDNHCANLSEWEFDVLTLTATVLRVANDKAASTFALILQDAAKVVRQAELFAKAQNTTKP